jgi:hypothetical protein
MALRAPDAKASASGVRRRPYVGESWKYPIVTIDGRGPACKLLFVISG